MIVQIYEVQDSVEAKKLCALGVDHIGVLVGEGAFPREIRKDRAADILSAVVAPAKKVVLSLSSGLPAIEEIASSLNPDILHLGSLLSDFGVAQMRELRRRIPQVKIMRSIPVVGQESVSAAEEFSTVSDFLLLDTYQDKDEQIGATGAVHDWAISRRIVERVGIPVILAGGLSPENVCNAIRAVEPAGVDSKTRTDLAGTHRKDFQKVERFVQLAKSCN